MWLTCPGCSARLEVPNLDVPLEQAVVSCECGVAGKLRFEQVRSRMDSAVTRLVARLREDLAANRLKLPALPDVVLRVEQMARDETAGAPQIAAVVERDPGLAAKLLRLANSVMFRGRVEARTVQQAIARLGMANLRGYVLAILSRELYVVDDRALGRFIERLWEHAITVAVAARELATRMRAGTLPCREPERAPDADLAFLGGLLHDIGKAVLLQITAKAVSRLLAQQQLAKVHAVLDALHTEAGAMVLAHWELPEEAVFVAAHHHSDEAPEAARAAQPLIDVVAVANRIAQRIGRDVKAEPDGALPPAASVWAERLGLGEVALADLEVELEDRVAEMASIL